MRGASDAPTTLVVPGLRDHVAQHWQTLLAARLEDAGRPVRTVPPMGRDDLSCAARVEAIEREAHAIDGPLVIVAHSGGCIMVAHWARRTRRAVQAALLATPPDFETPMPDGYPTLDALERRRLAAGAARAAAVPQHRRREPQRSARRPSSASPRMARAWGSRLVDLGEVGHLNPASGYGAWPHGRIADRASRADAAGTSTLASTPGEIDMAKAIRFQMTGGPEVLELETVEVGEPGPGQARVRHSYVAVNFIDIYFRTGRYPLPLPNGLGSDAVGVVEAVGEGVTDVRPGDRVGYLLGPQGAYSDVRVMPADVLIPLPAGVSDRTASTLMMKGMTAQYLFRQVYPLNGGETILYHAAAGGVGLVACQWARAIGVTMIGTVSTDEKAEVARANGCAHTIVTSREDIAKRVREITDGKGVPVVYDSVGKDTLTASLDSLQPRGSLVSNGTSSGPVVIDTMQLAVKGSIWVTRPAMVHYIMPRSHMLAMADELFGHVLAGRIVGEPKQEFALADAADAHRALESRRTTGATVLVP